MNLYRKHKNVADHKREQFNKEKQELSESFFMIIMDFKQNFKIGGGPEETNKEYYRKKDVTLLGFIIYEKNNGVRSKTHLNYVSKFLSHDSFFVKECLHDILKKFQLKKYKNISFWSDCGPHFRSSELQYHN